MEAKTTPAGGVLQQADRTTPISSKQKADLKELRKKCIQEVLREKSIDLEDVISADLQEFAKHLFKKELIRRPSYERVVNGVQGIDSSRMAADLALTVGTKLNLSPELFQEYTSVIREFNSGLADEMEQEYKERLEEKTKDTELRRYIAVNFPGKTSEPENVTPKEIRSRSSGLSELVEASHVQSIELDQEDICDQIANSPDMIPRLADRLHKVKLISKDTCQAVKSHSMSIPPYARASRMIEPAIQNAERNPKEKQVLITVLRQFNVRLK